VVKLMYYNGESWINVTMLYNATSGYYEAIIPELPANTIVKYKIYAEDIHRNTIISPMFSYTVMAGTTGGLPAYLIYLAVGGASIAVIALVAVILSKKR
ncbi:MAG: hypothetical protein J7L47_03865, partial [Candidatus Odinarchaeota archaeon]|nr:hypothetical protein [Candidatus Odinarchaeota archaeon]